jgi:hypothetical protein
MTEEDADTFHAVTPRALRDETEVYPAGIVMVTSHMTLVPVLLNMTVYVTLVSPTSVDVGDMLAV